MKAICPNCLIEAEVKFIKTQEEIKVKDELIKVEARYFKCLECQEEFEAPKSDYDPLEEAYREYRKRNNLLQPEEIKDFRKGLGLTQSEMAKILGWGAITLSRYENGSLQDEAHDKALRLAMQPMNLRMLIESTSNVLSEEKRKRLISELHETEREKFSLELIFEELFGGYEADIYSGFKKLDLSKFYNAILFFCKEGISKTKLCKLLFYSDFKHFKEYAVSITGSRYAHLPYGPVPDEFNLYYSILIDVEKAICVKELICEDKVGEIFTSIKKPDLSEFSVTELKILTTVKEFFQGYGAGKISEYSHKEKGYLETQTGHSISYDYADQLTI